MEAVPQMIILFVLFGMERELVLGLNPNLFYATLLSSLVTASLGIAKFLKTGPCRLVPDQGPLGGHATLGFLLLILNITSTIVSKGLMLNPRGINTSIFKNRQKYVAVWLAVCYLPQLTYVRKISTKLSSNLKYMSFNCRA